MDEKTNYTKAAYAEKASKEKKNFHRYHSNIHAAVGNTAGHKLRWLGFFKINSRFAYCTNQLLQTAVTHNVMQMNGACLPDRQASQQRLHYLTTGLPKKINMLAESCIFYKEMNE